MNHPPPHMQPPMHPQMPPHGQPPMAPEPPKRSTQSVIALVVAIIAMLAGIIPFAGALGLISLVLAIADNKIVKPGKDNGLNIFTIIVSGIALAGAMVWGGVFAVAATASCPHVYAYDGEQYRLDGDMVSGGMFPGGEKGDLDRLEHLREVDGTYRVRIQNDLEEIDYINDFALWVVDHDPDDQVLPTDDGKLVTVHQPAAPIAAVDEGGRDVLSRLAQHDDRFVGTDGADGESLRHTFTFEFAHPGGEQALLVLRGNNTAFAETAFVNYMAQMGQSVGPLMKWGLDDNCACHREYLDAEIDKLGLPLVVEVERDGVFVQAHKLGPVGPAVLRSQAIPVTVPASGVVRIRVSATERFWQIDQVQLAAAPDEAVEPQVLRPTRASFGDGDVRSLLGAIDDERVVLRTGERVDLVFDAPPVAEGKERTTVASLHGFYEMEVGGRPGINPAYAIAHQLGLVSLPEFAREHAAEFR